MVLLGLMSVALAAPLGNPAPDRDHGVVRLTGTLGDQRLPRVAAGERYNLRSPESSLRVDVVPVTGVGVWARTGRRTTRLRPDYEGRGWTVAGGARGAVWVVPGVAIAGAAEVEYGVDWSEDDADTIDGVHRGTTVTGFLGAVVGQRGGGLYAWGGARADALHAERLETTAGLDLSLKHRRPVAVVLGGEAVSEDLIDGPGRAIASIGLEVSFIEGFGAHAYAGIAF